MEICHSGSGEFCKNVKCREGYDLVFGQPGGGEPFLENVWFCERICYANERVWALEGPDCLCPEGYTLKYEQQRSRNIGFAFCRKNG